MLKHLRAVAAACLLVGSTFGAHAGLLGSTVNVTYYFPDLATQYCDNGNQVVGAGVEYPAGCSGFSPVIIDFSDSGFSVDTQGNAWAGGSFNGFIVDVLAGLDFDTVVYAGGSMGVTSATVSSGDLLINFSGQGGGIANFRFTQAGATPEPASLALVGLALVAAGAARSRRRA